MNKKLSLFLKNVFYAVGANMTRILTTLILTLLLPKIMSVESYSYWQLYHFYVTYLVYSTLGWTEGLYMKYGGTPWQELDRRRVSGQIWGILVHEMIFACVAAAAGCLLIRDDTTRRNLILCALIYVVIHVFLTQLQTALQAANRISEYAKVYSLERFLFLLLSVACVLAGKIGFWSFILVEILSNTVLALYALYLCREVVFTKPMSWKQRWREKWELIRIGFSVSFAAFLGQAIIGVVRFGVERRFGTVAFGKLSLSFSMANMAVTCITAVSIVIFPILKRLDREKAGQLYAPIRQTMTFPLFGLLLFYAPARFVLSLWLPEYADSLRYLAVLLPFCIYEVRSAVLTCTYLKVWMAQKYIMYANLITLGISVIVTWITVFVIGRIDWAAASIMGLYALKSILTEMAVKRYVSLELRKTICFELALTAGFMLLSWNGSLLFSLSGYLICYGLFLLWGRKEFLQAYHTLKEEITH